MQRLPRRDTMRLHDMTPNATQNRGEQSDARERRSRADLQWTINRRRPVIGGVR